MFRFEKLDNEYKSEIASWVYDEHIKCYDAEERMSRVDDLIENPGYDFYVGLNEIDDIVGFVECFFHDEDMEVSHALNPSYTGRGLSNDFICSSVNFLIEKYNYTRDTILIHVDKYNEIALKAYRRAGFVEIRDVGDLVRLELVLD